MSTWPKLVFTTLRKEKKKRKEKEKKKKKKEKRNTPRFAQTIVYHRVPDVKTW
jgi:hypothetical protein